MLCGLFASQPNKSFGDGVIKARPVLRRFDQFALVGDLSLRESPALTSGNFLARVILRRRLLDSGQLAVQGRLLWRDRFLLLALGTDRRHRGPHVSLSPNRWVPRSL